MHGWLRFEINDAIIFLEGKILGAQMFKGKMYRIMSLILFIKRWLDNSCYTCALNPNSYTSNGVQTSHLLASSYSIVNSTLRKLSKVLIVRDTLTRVLKNNM